MITLHHLNDSRSERFIWLLKELDLPFEVKTHQRNPKTFRAPEEARRIHPLGKFPIITHNDKVIAETGAITEYLLKLSPKLKNYDPERHTYWLHYAEGSLMTPFLFHLVFDHVEKAKAPFFVKPIIKKVCENVRKSFITPELNLHLNYLNDYLKDHAFFAGEELSAADIIMSFPIECAERLKLLETRPVLKNYFEKIKKLKKA